MELVGNQEIIALTRQTPTKLIMAVSITVADGVSACQCGDVQ